MAEQKACARGWVHAFLGCGWRASGKKPFRPSLCSATSPQSEEAFLAGIARENSTRAKPAQKGAPLCGELAELAGPEGLFAACRYISPSGSRYAPSFTHSK